MAFQILFGEKASTKFAAFFDTERELDEVSAELRRVSGLQNTQLWVVPPHDAGYERKLEPETQGVVRTAVRSHLVLGAIGLVAGVLIWGVLYLMGLPAIVSSPFYSAAAVIAFSTVAGLLLGGLVTARPDHQIVIQAVGSATAQGRWSLVAHPRNEEQCKAVEAVLQAAAVENVRSI
ncbi:hypothetical protein [Yanghanlia caeni]|uniref:Riboflavin biosynthesis protein RibA n=1 Tax=Yanghanlia caeni TaxID=3064283 RepID=A0ABU1D5B5_9BURK|nr:hypothetical protein [Alcaligenaceae bacterium LG-2]HZH57505.1 hypothetical protein [Burkholderiaceae bacterium]